MTDVKEYRRRADELVRKVEQVQAQALAFRQRALTAEDSLARIRAITRWWVPRGYGSHLPTRSTDDVVQMLRWDDVRAVLDAADAPLSVPQNADGPGHA